MDPADRREWIRSRPPPKMAERLADEVQRLRTLVEANENKAAMHDLAEDLNSVGMYRWAETLGRGDRRSRRSCWPWCHRNEGGEHPLGPRHCSESF
jgi:hypothetical protein